MICLFNTLIHLISLSSVLSQGISSSVNGSIVCPDLRPKIQESSIILLFSSPFTQYISKFYWLFLLNTSYLFFPPPSLLPLSWNSFVPFLFWITTRAYQEFFILSLLFDYICFFKDFVFLEKFQVYKNIERKVQRYIMYLLLPHMNSLSNYQHFLPEWYFCYNQ